MRVFFIQLQDVQSQVGPRRVYIIRHAPHAETDQLTANPFIVE